MEKRKNIVKKMLVDFNLTLAGLARLLHRSKANLSYHFTRDDISEDLYNEIIKALTDKFQTNITQTYTGGEDSQTESDMIGNFIGNQKEIHYHTPIQATTIQDISEPYKKTISLLEEKIETQKQIIKQLEIEVQEKNKIIEQLKQQIRERKK